MSIYILNFIVYTTAMIGVICLAVFVYKKFSCNNISKSKFLNIEDCLNLAPRKTLYVIKAGEEKFLVAADADKTTLISKLSENETPSSNVDSLPEIVDLQKLKYGNKKIFKSIMNNL